MLKRAVEPPVRFMLILHLISAAIIGSGIPQDCTAWQECRDLAVAAASRGEYESFHDLAWRAAQKGPKKDPALLLLVARAQSLSGRPGDALVMLARLADMGVATDAATSDDFRRVRAIAGWPELVRRIAGLPAPAAKPGEPTASTPVPPTPAPLVSKPRAGDAAEPAAAATAAAPPEALRFTTPGLTPDGLAYDRVSRRLLVADRERRKLAVVDEFSQNVATLAGVQASFGDIEALEIDSRAGDLWVVTSEPAAAGGAATLHKLQLVSGRVLATFTVAPALAPAHFVDVAVGAAGGVLVLDSEGSRVLRLRGGALETAAPVPAGATSLAPTDNGSVYVSLPDGIARVDLATRGVSMVTPAGGVILGALSRIRYDRGSLIAIQREGSGTLIVRLRLDRSGRMITAVDLIDAIEAAAGAFTISEHTLFYYASKKNDAVVVKRVSLK